MQFCFVHIVRNSLTYVSWKLRKRVARDLRVVYHAATLEQAETALYRFVEHWDEQYPTISRLWCRHWDNLTQIYDFSSGDQEVIYTTNDIETLNWGLRKIIKTRGAFPSDEAAKKSLYLVLLNLSRRRTRPLAN